MCYPYLAINYKIVSHAAIEIIQIVSGTWKMSSPFSLNFPTDCANSGTIAPFLIPLCCAFPFIILSLNLFVQSNLSNNRCHKQNLLTCSSRSPWQHSGVPKSLLHLRTSITLPTTTQSINVQKLTTLLFMDDSLFQILQNFSLRH